MSKNDANGPSAKLTPAAQDRPARTEKKSSARLRVERIHSRTMLLEVAGPEGEEDVMNAAEQLIAEGERRGEQRGEQKGLRAAIVTALEARSVPLSEVGRARVASCTDVATLTRWLARAVTASSEADVFASEGAP